MMQWAISDLPDDVELINGPLGRAGYRCGYVGKWHCGDSKVPTTYGFEGMDVPNYGNPYQTKEYKEYLERTGLKQPERKTIVEDCTYRPAPIAGELVGDTRASGAYFLTEYALDMMREFQAGREATGDPWMMFAALWMPHHPYFPPTEYAEMYKPEDMVLWESTHDDLAGKPPHQERFRRTCYHGNDFSDDTWRQILALHFAQMTYTDAMLGRLFAGLDELGIADNTVVLFGTDHGDMSGSHGGFIDKGSYMYEEIYHVPQMVRWPGVTAPGSVCNEFVTNMDLAPTALAAAGVDVPGCYQARSLAPLCQGDASEWPDDVVCEYHGHRYLFSQRMVRWASYKYVFNAPSFDELYDLDADPHEMTNLIDDPAYTTIGREGRERLLRRIDEHDDPLRHAAYCMLGEHAWPN